MAETGNLHVGRSISAGPDGGGRGVFVLRMAPLIDIIFLLLIFFLVSSEWGQQESYLPFDLPAAKAGEGLILSAEPMVILVSGTVSGCEVSIGGAVEVEVSEGKVDEGLAAVMVEIKRFMEASGRVASDPVELVFGGDVEWDYAAKIYNVFYGAGMTDVTFAMVE